MNSYSNNYIFGILRKIDCFVFEELLLLCLKQRGFCVVNNQAYTGDGGIDGTFYDNHGNKFVIQAKRYSSAINPKHVDEFVRLVNSSDISGGLFIHTGRTGRKSYQALSSKVRFISGENLITFLKNS